MSEQTNNETADRTATQAAQEIVNGGVSGTTSGGRSVSFLSLSELDAHEVHEEKKRKGRNPAAGIFCQKITGGTPRY